MMTPCPEPVAVLVNIAGFAADKVIGSGDVYALPCRTITCVFVFTGRPYGIIVLICPLAAYSNGAGKPPMVTSVPDSWDGRGSAVALDVPLARLEPKMAIIEPGARGADG